MNISVKRDGAEVEYGSCGAHDVTRYPRVAELLAKHPIPGEKL